MPLPDNSRISVETLREYLGYCPESGRFWWLKKPNKSVAVTQTPGTINRVNGYVYVTIRGKKMLTHRVAWALAHGYHPEHQIDHINGDKQDNRLANLREAAAAENGANCRVRSHNKCGWKGVQEVKSGRYVALISRDRVQRYLGTYDTPEAAHEAYMAAAKELHGEFAFNGVR